MASPALRINPLPLITGRDPKYKEIDKSALQAIAQAAVNVELFTIPLYMTSLFSIQGTHAISNYTGRLWPGAASTANPQTANEQAFNLIFSVFIEEMLHLQMAANVANTIGYTPVFTNAALQGKNHNWTCYGDTLTTIPHILDLQDTIPYTHVRVKLDSLNVEHLDLFLAIEESETTARTRIQPDKLSKYFPTVPFEGWQQNMTEADLPLFGSIGHMYHCYQAYMQIEYSDGTTLWDAVYNPASLQGDQFNTVSSGHPYREYQKLDTTVSGWLPAEGLHKAMAMIQAITDQGEGSTKPVDSNDVEARFRPSFEAMEKAYSADDATARFGNSAIDHYERFVNLKAELACGHILTWDQWHAQGNVWTADMLHTAHYDSSLPIPSPEDVAAALNGLKTPEMYVEFSKIAVGSIKGITTVLNDYWAKPGTTFPNPSMYGSGDRVSICWAIFGQPPDLSQQLADPNPSTLYHACQGLSLTEPGNDCAAVEVFHTCRGSNTCKAQGGCGFVQTEQGGGSCGGHSGVHTAVATDLNGCNPFSGAGIYTAPSDNRCQSFGGCAVPISASQIYWRFPASTNPKVGVMQLFNFTGADNTPTPLSKMDVTAGETVFDVAWTTFGKVMAARGKSPGDKPGANMLRTALPPST